MKKKKMFLVPFLLASTLSFCFATMVAFGANINPLPPEEAQALVEIAKTLGKTDWDFSKDPCTRQSGWSKPEEDTSAVVRLGCNCSGENVCNVVSISLKCQNLSGTLPPNLTGLPYLQEIELTRNYLNGSIPPGWGSSTQLVNISLLGNRLTGSIPKELANIPTLKSFVVEFNQLSGNLPPELGKMSSIERFFLTSNNFTGELPDSFARLNTLEDFRIGDNHFSGKIPNYIQNWTKLEKLVIQASGLNGPIPSSIAHLKNLTDLRISDLNGSEQPFPPLDNLTKLKTLILRNCNITGELPDYLGNRTKLKTLDLSFNNLSGKIPSNFSGLYNATYIYLTRNLLTGEVPVSMLKANNTDLSYNNFTVGGSGPSSCQTSSVNLFSPSLIGNNFGLSSCLESIKCPNRNFIPPSENGISLGAKVGIVVASIIILALLLKEKESLLELVDPRLGSNYKKEEVMVMINVALLCTNASAAIRPTMSLVVSMLEGGTIVPVLVSDPSVSDKEMKEAMMEHFQLSKEQNMHARQIESVSSTFIQSTSTDGPWTASSTSAADLYPVNLNSNYLEKRA
ncbi:hypothetical protein FH972_019537 [Carpinus fangiana]|uniref:Leucine-rich repeat-containing N-terminal plant-type domain-containing protein n=1 Tax=Carpinus fangiana TaxID=176857 RepID=A0A5N6RQY4_9ROSI|nr:hypothetical protein FH972_019537 [Carpinus fangiana]